MQIAGGRSGGRRGQGGRVTTSSPEFGSNIADAGAPSNSALDTALGAIMSTSGVGMALGTVSFVSGVGIIVSPLTVFGWWL